MKEKRYRPDKDGVHRAQFDKARRRILAAGGVCGICGQPVDMALKYPDPMSATVDHIIPIDKGGHPSDMKNLQLAHLSCNRAKGDKVSTPRPGHAEPVNNRNLPQAMDWTKYTPER